jgi:hypothetical protein
MIIQCSQSHGANPFKTQYNMTSTHRNREQVLRRFWSMGKKIGYKIIRMNVIKEKRGIQWDRDEIMMPTESRILRSYTNPNSCMSPKLMEYYLLQQLSM